MSGGWKVGDLATPRGGIPKNTMGDRHGLTTCGIYRVTEVVCVPQGVGISLEGAEFKTTHQFWLASAFRKIKPKAEPCEEEFTALIKRMKPAKVVA